jgi:hypothetical protein
MPAEPIPHLRKDCKTHHLPMIYILGNSKSGSTLPGFLLSSNPSIINLGEIKSKTWLKERLCACGQPVKSCPFYKSYFEAFNSIKDAASHMLRYASILRLRLNGKIDQDPRTNLIQLFSATNELVINSCPESHICTNANDCASLSNVISYCQGFRKITYRTKLISI